MGGVTDFLVGAYRANKQGTANAAAHEQKLRAIEAEPSRKKEAPYSSYRRDANSQYEATQNGTRPAKVAPDPAPVAAPAPVRGLSGKAWKTQTDDIIDQMSK